MPSRYSRSWQALLPLCRGPCAPWVTLLLFCISAPLPAPVHTRPLYTHQSLPSAPTALQVMYPNIQYPAWSAHTPWLSCQSSGWRSSDLKEPNLKAGGVPPKESQNCRGPLSPSLHTSPCSSPPTPLLLSTPSQVLHCVQRQRRGLWGGVAWRRGPPPSGHSLGCGRAQRKDDLESAGQMLEKGGRGRPFLDPQPISALPSPISPGVG